MNIWKIITLQKSAIVAWQQTSYLSYLTTPLQQWRSVSTLLSQGRFIGLLLIALVFLSAPFVSTTFIGLLLIGCAGLWFLLLISDGRQSALSPIHIAVMLYWGIATIATAFSPVRDAATEGWIKLTLYLILFALMTQVMQSQRIGKNVAKQDNIDSDLPEIPSNKAAPDSFWPSLRSWVIGVYLHVALLVSAVGLRQWCFGVDALATWVDVDSSLAGTTRVYSYLGNPNLLAGYLIPAIFLSLGAVFVWQRWYGTSNCKIDRISRGENGASSIGNKHPIISMGFGN